MPKSRINKFIFQEGSVFLRLKTKAKDLVFKRDGENYSVEFFSGSSPGKKLKIQVMFLPDLTGIPDSGVTSQTYSWGRLIKEENSAKDAQFYYYVIPEKRDYAAKLGPFSADIFNSDLEIDWENIQWGASLASPSSSPHKA